MYLVKTNRSRAAECVILFLLPLAYRILRGLTVDLFAHTDDPNLDTATCISVPSG